MQGEEEKEKKETKEKKREKEKEVEEEKKEEKEEEKKGGGGVVVSTTVSKSGMYTVRTLTHKTDVVQGFRRTIRVTRPTNVNLEVKSLFIRVSQSHSTFSVS